LTREKAEYERIRQRGALENRKMSGAFDRMKIGAGNGFGLLQMWWADSAKSAELDAAQRDPSKNMEVGAVEDRYWVEFDAKQRAAVPSGGTK